MVQQRMKTVLELINPSSAANYVSTVAKNLHVFDTMYQTVSGSSLVPLLIIENHPWVTPFVCQFYDRQISAGRSTTKPKSIARVAPMLGGYDGIAPFDLSLSYSTAHPFFLCGHPDPSVYFESIDVFRAVATPY